MHLLIGLRNGSVVSLPTCTLSTNPQLRLEFGNCALIELLL